MHEFADAVMNIVGDPPTAQVEIGTIGWVDEAEWYEKGTDDNDGHTLVRVQLYRGRDPKTPPKQGIADGHKILAHIADGIFRLPKKGTRCYVLMPAGYESIPGAGVIVACVSKSPTTQFEDDRVVVDFGSDVHVLIKGRSVSLSDDASPACFLGVGTPRAGGSRGIQLVTHDGTGAAWQSGKLGLFVGENGAVKTIVQLTTSEVSAGVNGGSLMQLTTSKATLFGQSVYCQGAGVYLGLLPTALTGAQYGPDAGTSLTSATVFVSP